MNQQNINRMRREKRYALVTLLTLFSVVTHIHPAPAPFPTTRKLDSLISNRRLYEIVPGHSGQYLHNLYSDHSYECGGLCGTWKAISKNTIAIYSQVRYPNGPNDRHAQVYHIKFDLDTPDMKGYGKIVHGINKGQSSTWTVGNRLQQ